MTIHFAAENAEMAAYCDAHGIAYDFTADFPHTLTLNANGGTVSGQQVLRLTANWAEIPDLPPATREGYVFSGWYTDELCTVPFTGVMPARDLTLYAEWGKKGANGIYRINGGSAILTGYAMLENENTSVYLPETVEGKPLTGIAPRAFAGTNVGTVFIPATVTEIELGAFADSDLSRINVDSNNPVYSSLNGVLYSKDGSQLLACPPMLYTLSIPEGVTAIASYAFDGAALREITLPENICTIDERAFRNTEISELRLPAGVENIGTRAFTDCKNLARVEAVGSPDVIGDYAFAGCDPFLLVYGPDEDCALKQAAASVNAYYNAYTLTIYEDGAERSLLLPAGTSLLLPEKPTVGENRQFTGWYLEESFETRFTETTMPAHDLELWAGESVIFTFATLDGENPALKLTACAALEMTVTIPESIEGSPVTTIASGCFGGAYTSVTIPACVTEIEDGAFAPDTVLIYEPGSYAETWAAEHGFTAEERTWTLRYETGCLLTQESINLPAGAEIPLPTLQRDAYEFLGWSLEENGSVLESVVMPAADSVLYAQWDVTNWELASLLQDLEWETSGNNVIVTAYNGTAESLSLPGSINGKPVTAIGTDAFAYNSTLQRVELPAGLTTIGDSAFFSMRSLRSMEIPAGVQSIGVKAFGSCPALMRVILSEGVQTIGAGAFENTALHSITLPSSLTSIDATTLRGCALLEAVEVADGNRFYRSIDGILYDTADGVLVKYPAARESDSYSVSDVWSIGAWAFHGADRLVSVTLPEDLYSLGEGAFYGCAALNAMPTLGSIVTRIPSQCFYGCISMTEAILPDTIKQIGSQAFAKTSLTELLIPDFVTTIGVQAVDSSVLMRGAAGGYAQTWAGENGVSFLPTGSMTIESLSFGAETLTLMRGKRQQTSLAAEPANAALENIRYFSSDDSVAKIDENGLIYALGKGKATLYASAPGDVLARCVIEVTAPPEPESLRLSTETQTLTIGQSVALTVAISPLEAAQSQITWTSSKKNIAWIDESNRLYAIGVGKTVIRATAENGVYAELSISCEGVDATFTVPAMLKQIGDEAFAGIAAEYVILPDGTTSIGNCAFAGSSSLRVIRIPGTVTTLGTDLFSGCGDVLILAPTGSAAETYAKDHALRFAPIE